MKHPLGTLLALVLLSTPVAQAGYYAHHDDIGGALEDILDGYGRPDEGECPDDTGEGDGGEGCEDEDGGQGGDVQGDDDGAPADTGTTSWLEWLIVVWATQS